MCTGINPVSPDGFTAPAGTKNTLILWDLTRISGTVAEKAALSTKLDAFKNLTSVNGAVVDLGTFTGKDRIALLNQHADQNPGCVYAKNLVATGIKDVVDAYRGTIASPKNPIKYVVLVGGDATIPFFRYPDQNELGPEKDYIPPVAPTSPSEASLRSDYVLGQDEYGSRVSLSLGMYNFPIPDLAVGRLVETATEASGMIDAYTATDEWRRADADDFARHRLRLLPRRRGRGPEQPRPRHRSQR